MPCAPFPSSIRITFLRLGERFTTNAQRLSLKQTGQQSELEYKQSHKICTLLKKAKLNFEMNQWFIAKFFIEY